MPNMAIEECCNCGITFHVPAVFQKACRADSRKTFYCPNGHGQSYTESEADKLRQERDRLKQNEAWYEARLKDAQADADAQKRQAAAYKGIATRIKNRVKQGVCPCCNRTFSDLARHVKTKHPDFDNVVPMEIKA